MSGQMTKGDASRIQSGNAKSGNDSGFAARAQSAADRSANTAASKGSNGGNGGNSGGAKKG
ncbi:uncharacterized protein SEPMUDRAFT_120926 [Sphaerulina musiva SO2202]|uniref:SMP domain-containing protein n=1 Tax=Sphaerulina musiva (strain SO2202) TaxID=692275 RepID=M3CB28_SPHMS|nr:uncharacterized protein SEPMUDRAFT_120926 [Sphaerulina musiva SO2202]EMF09040.1 hypothetical protein SEPMUDRAFT_120926 [Sphaerulina musiva SO2202]